MDIIEINGGFIVLTIDDGIIDCYAIACYPQAEDEIDLWIESHPKTKVRAVLYADGWGGAEEILAWDLEEYK